MDKLNFTRSRSPALVIYCLFVMRVLCVTTGHSHNDTSTTLIYAAGNNVFEFM